MRVAKGANALWALFAIDAEVLHKYAQHTHTHTHRLKATRGKLLQSEFLCRRHSEKYATEMRNDSRQQVESKSRGREEEVEEGEE